MPNMGRTIVDAEPGSYKVSISPSDPDRRYAVLVEECGVPEVSWAGGLAGGVLAGLVWF